MTPAIPEPPAAFTHTLSIDIAAPPALVWRTLADYGRDAQWREGVRVTTEPPGLVRDGTVTREDLRMLGSWHRTTAQIREVVPGRSFRFVSDDGRVDGVRRVEAHDGGTRVTVAIRVAVPGGLGVLAPLLGWLFRRRVTRDLERLARLVTRSATDDRLDAAAAGAILRPDPSPGSSMLR